ncbi:MAG: rhodanese-like domain-containing protein [Casimicrobiaceae bacterium]
MALEAVGSKEGEGMDPAAIRERALARAREIGAPFRGFLLPAEAWALFASGEAELVDTRTHAERDWVGYVPGGLHIEWYGYPSQRLNERFLDQLREKVPRDRPVAFLCRNGVRSRAAAALATGDGYGEAFDILYGFEGDANARGQRGTINGWRFAGLPWRQD